MIITISREYGAGGQVIGKAVAKELGIEFYDRDIIRSAAEKSGLDTEEVERLEEETSRADKFLRAISPSAYVDHKDALNSIERQIILSFALKEPCVILGRCADDILSKAGIPCLNIFLYASDIHRAVRVGELIGTRNPTEIQKRMQRKDAARRSFYQHYTGKRWGESRNYDMSLDTGVLGYDNCVRLICDAARSAEKFKGADR